MENIGLNCDEFIKVEIPAPDGESNLDNEPVKSLCRCCLSVDKPTKDAMSFRSHFRDLAGLHIFPSDGLPQRICYECSALLLKSVRFKHKMIRANMLLVQYLGRCAPFPIDPTDPELTKYASPLLSIADILVTDSIKDKKGFHRITQLEHKKSAVQSKLDSIYILPDTIDDLNDAQKVKQEADCDDDDITLNEYRSTAKLSLEDASIGSITQDDLDQILNQNESDRESNTSKERKNKKHNKDKGRRKAKRCKDPVATMKDKSSIRSKPMELDPTKIKEITLNPEEQIKQREEESQTNMKYPFRCHLCYKGFNFEVKLQNHMTKHSPSRGSHECKLCHMFLPTAYSHAVHSRIHTMRYQCMSCNVRMIDRTSILLHYQSQHEGIVSSYKCQICGKVSNNYKTYRGHMRNKHSGERPTCDLCGKTFVNKDSLTEHIQIHQGIKNYECSLCNKRFRTRTQIKVHQLSHTDVRDFYCVECDVRFKSEHSLRQHLLKNLNHKDRNSFKFACENCDKRFETQPSLSHHVSVVHEGVRAHACDICGAALATRGSLRKHVLSVHGGHRATMKHQCHTCGKAFRNKSVLTNHVRTHTGEKPHSCATCGRKFAQRTAMLTHVKLVHLKLRRNAKIKPEIAVKPREMPKEDLPLPFPKEEGPLFDGYFFVPLNTQQP